MRRKIKLKTFEVIKEGELLLTFEDDWFIEGETIINDDASIGFLIDKPQGEGVYTAKVNHLEREIRIGDEFKEMFNVIEEWDSLFDTNYKDKKI